MFEDSTFESSSRIKTKSGRWMLVTGSINAAILVLLILIPLIYRPFDLYTHQPNNHKFTDQPKTHPPR